MKSKPSPQTQFMPINRQHHLLLRLLLLLVFATMTSASAADYVLVVDTSGSMRDPISHRDKRIRTEVVQKALREYLPALPQPSRVCLIAFNSGIVSEQELMLKDTASLHKALAWVDDIAHLTKNHGQTYLWTTLQQALEVATRYSIDNHGQPVIVRVLTDGEDNQGVTTLEEVLKHFPLVDGEHIRGNLVLLGDLELKTKLALPEGAFTTTTTTSWADLFPPVVLCFPSNPRTGDEVRFVENTHAIYAVYDWFVDGFPVSHEKILCHNFSETGTHKVTLKVKGIQGNGDETTVIINVQPRENFTVDVLTSASAAVSPGETVRFWAKPSAPATRVVWFVDGQEAGLTGELNRQFISEGTYAIKTVAWSAEGATATNSRTMVVKEPALTAHLKGPEQVTAGESVQFASEISGPCARLQWRFGDAATSSDPNPEHVFVLDGQTSKNFQVWLHVESPSGHMVEVGPHTVRVQGRSQAKAPVASFRLIEQNFRTGDAVHLVDESRGFIESWEWRVDDVLVASDKNPVIKFARPGTNLVTLIVHGPGGNSKAVKPVQVFPRYIPVQIWVAASCVSGKAPLAVQFTNHTTGDVRAWFWEFGDGQTSTNANPRHIFALATNYCVAVTAFPVRADGKPPQAQLTIKVMKPFPLWAKAATLAGVLAGLGGLAAWYLRRREKERLRLTVYCWPEQVSVCRRVDLNSPDEAKDLRPDVLLRIHRVGTTPALIAEALDGACILNSDGSTLTTLNIGQGARLEIKPASGIAKSVAIAVNQKPRRPSPATVETLTPPTGTQSSPVTPVSAGDFDWGLETAAKPKTN